jgi:heat shock protein HtpX
MPVTFRDLIADNKCKSFWLVAGFVLFTLVVAGILALAIILAIDPELVDHLSWSSGIAAGVIVAGISFLLMYLAYRQGDQLILGISGASPIEKSDDSQLFNVVEEMAIAAGIPMPRVYLIHDEAPNAFATGRDPEHASVAITTGLREKLNRDELQGIIAPEISHIRNYDIRLMMLLAVLIGTIVLSCWPTSSGKSCASPAPGPPVRAGAPTARTTAKELWSWSLSCSRSCWR